MPGEVNFDRLKARLEGGGRADQYMAAAEDIARLYRVQYVAFMDVGFAPDDAMAMTREAMKEVMRTTGAQIIEARRGNT